MKVALAVIFGVLASINSWAIDTVATGFKVNNSTTKAITAFGVCKKVANASGYGQFVSTKTNVEWNSFQSNTPTNVTLSECGSCKDILDNGGSTGDGVYYINPAGGAAAFPVYCDMTTSGGGWTLVWSNTRGGTNKPLTSINWSNSINTLPRCSQANAASALDSTGSCSYISNNKEGFNYYIGLKYWNFIAENYQNMEMMYSWANDYGSAIDRATIVNAKKFDAREDYLLRVSNLQNIVGSQSPGLFTTHNGQRFSTFDADNDVHSGNCATFYTNTPFWYSACWSGNLNGGGEATSGGYYNGSYWTSSAKQWGDDVSGNGAGNGWVFVRAYKTYSNCNEIKKANPSAASGSYLIDSDGAGGNAAYNVYCDMTTDGGGWTRVFHHDVAGGYFATDAEAATSNVGNINHAKYSILSKLEDFRSFGRFKMKISWPGHAGTNTWIQDSNPNTDPVSGYMPVSIASTSNYWGGLEKSTVPTETYIDGSVNHSNWYYSVGSKVSWGAPLGHPAADGIAGSGVGVPIVEVWTKDLDAPVYRSCKDILDHGDSTGDGSYYIDPDGPGGSNPYAVHCDMTTDGGGWTLTAWNRGNSTTAVLIPDFFVSVVNAGNAATPTAASAASINVESFSKTVKTTDAMLKSAAYSASPIIENGMGMWDYDVAKCSGTFFHTSRTAGCAGQNANDNHTSADKFNLSLVGGNQGIVPHYTATELCYPGRGWCDFDFYLR